MDNFNISFDTVNVGPGMEGGVFHTVYSMTSIDELNLCKVDIGQFVTTVKRTP